MGFVGNKALGVNISTTSTDAIHELGLRVGTSDGGEYVYVVAGSGGVSAGQPVAIADGWTVTAAANGFAFGAAHVAIAASSYGWVMTKGRLSSAAVATGISSGDMLAGVAASNQFAAVAAVDEGGSTSHSAGDHYVRAIALDDESSNAAPIILL